MNPVGPVELLVVAFPGNKFTGDMAPELTRLVESGTINVIDLVFVHKDADGAVSVFELGDLDPAESTAFTRAVREVESVFSDDDAWRFAAMLDNDSSAGLLLFENAWAAGFASAMRNAGGQVLLNERLPREAMDELIADSLANGAN